jgi:hypothetical protein
LRGKIYVSVRNTSRQNKIYLNDEEMGVKKFCDILEKEAFTIQEDVSNLTFRALISRFIRPRKESYVSFDSIYSKEKPYNKILCNAFLLGLDIDLITKKYELKTERDRIETFKKNLNKDSVFKEFFTENKNVEIELKDIDDRIIKLERDSSEYKVAENYYEVQKEADNIKRDLQIKKNKAIAISNVRLST